MESDGNGKDRTDIKPRAKVCSGDVAQGIGLSKIAKSSDYDSTSTTESIVDNPTMMDTITVSGVDSVDESPREDEGNEFFNLEQIPTLPTKRTTELKAIGPANHGEDGEGHASTPSCNGSKTKFVESEENLERNGVNTLKIDSIGNNSSGSERSIVSEGEAGPTLIPSPVIIDSIEGIFSTNIVCDPRSSVERKGLKSSSITNKVSDQISDANLLFRNQQGNQNSSSCGIRQVAASLTIASLPIDSLHNIASFLIPIEWKIFGQCSKATNKICKEIFRRVRMHGFRCATEVVTAWKFGQHADAKELCALYINAGVPIYPHCLGHSYHTLIWRLSIEAKHLLEQEEANKKNITPSNTNTFCESTPSNAPKMTDHPPLDPSAGISASLDPFFNDRDDFRMREDLIDGLDYDLTYLEEKSLYTLNAKDNQSATDRLRRHNRRRTSIDHAARGVRNSLPVGLAHGESSLEVARMNPFPSNSSGVALDRNRWNSHDEFRRGSVQRRGLSRSNSFSGNRYRAPNVSLKIHRHLLDQHLLGRSGVNDFDGTMNTPMTSLSADFFHPFFSIRSTDEAVRYESNGIQDSNSTVGATSGLLPAYHQFPPVTMEQMASDGYHANIGERSTTQRIESTISNIVDDSDSDTENGLDFQRSLVINPPRLNNADEMVAAGASLQPPAMVPPIPPSTSMNTNRRGVSDSAGIVTELKMITHQVTANDDILSNVDLDVYSASSKSLKSHNNDERRLFNYLKARFTVYHCCLERHLFSNDCYGFEETIMDFWDEFLPQTANIQYYDRHTAVPRVSRLEKFLTSPCPRQIGIIECEIERVKTSPKKKGVNMKGRFFPTYEYRLFIRHRPTEQPYDLINNTSNNINERRDTVLMMAKNRIHKNADNSAQTSKKGSNNYYLSLPLQEDLNHHYKNVNGQDDPRKISQNGIGKQSGSSEFPGLLGRLQSNFVGTEFQIFTPRLTSGKRKPQFSSGNTSFIPQTTGSGTNSDDEVLYDIGHHGELKSMSTVWPRSRFGRLSLRGRNGNNVDGDVNNRAEFSDTFQKKSPKASPLTLRRSRSSDATPGRNRKISAAESFFESQSFKTEAQRIFSEEEDGAITYTANLLGSRPRIMDVCIPKVNHDGTAMEWRRLLENCNDKDADISGDLLLNHLKQIQHNSQMEERRRLADPTIGGEEVFNDDEQNYSLSDDSGLLALQNRPPWWNVELGSFVLNFGGRVSVASVKNFQLCDRHDQDHIMLQFGRIEGRHSFTMDFQYPLTAVQAFAIAISSLQSKISFG